MAVRWFFLGLTVVLICSSGTLVDSAGLNTVGSVPSATSLISFDDDPTIYNDCNYCHGVHGARRDVSAVLNEHAERYDRYLGGGSLGDRSERSVFADGTSRNCPRSRTKSD